MNLFNRSIMTKLSLTAILLAIVVLVVTVVGLKQNRQILESTEWVRHTHEVLESLERFLSELKDAETGQRGYLLTSNETYLEPYQTGIVSVWEELKRFKALTSDNPDQQQRIESLRPLITEKFAELRETINLHQSRQIQEALDVVNSDRGKQTMDTIRVRIIEMAAEEYLLLDQRMAIAEQTARNTTIGMTGFAVIGIVIGGGLSTLIITAVVRRVTLLTQHTKQVESSGDVGKRVPDLGDDEVGQLAEAFNAMTDNLQTVIVELQQSEASVKTLNNELESRSKSLEKSDAELQQFAYIASHDLKEPLRSIQCFVQMLQEDYEGNLDEQADELIRCTVKATEKMQLLIEDLVNLPRIDSQAKPFEPVEMDDVFADVLSALKTSIRDAGAEVNCDKLPSVMDDRFQIAQLLQNLIGNAIKYRGDEAPLVYVAVAEKADSWQFCVSDNGIGIDPKYANQIFEIFKRLHSEAQYPGTGIGLAVCRRVVERHGGKIWLDSAEGEGSTFYFTIAKQSEQTK